MQHTGIVVAFDSWNFLFFQASKQYKLPAGKCDSYTYAYVAIEFTLGHETSSSFSEQFLLSLVVLSIVTTNLMMFIRRPLNVNFSIFSQSRKGEKRRAKVPLRLVFKSVEGCFANKIYIFQFH